MRDARADLHAEDICPPRGAKPNATVMPSVPATSNDKRRFSFRVIRIFIIIHSLVLCLPL